MAADAVAEMYNVVLLSGHSDKTPMSGIRLDFFLTKRSVPSRNFRSRQDLIVVVNAKVHGQVFEGLIDA